MALPENTSTEVVKEEEQEAPAAQQEQQNLKDKLIQEAKEIQMALSQNSK